MPHICPRPCSRLATAAVYISVGVVQFVVGIILLRSKYVYLLAGPDFWTSSCNIAVGCLLGMSASVWKQSRKRVSQKHAIRRNLLLALMFSALILNATTLGILLLGKGNTLLSIRLESNGKYTDSTLAREILAYAYVTSVCCPIVCIVISIVSMSGSCFKHVSRKKSKEMKTPIDRMEEQRSRALRWIYSPELLDVSKKKIRELVLSSSESSSSDEETEIPTQRRTSADSSEDVQQVFNHMAQGKRDSILSDSAIMLRQMDLLRKSKYGSQNQDGTYLGPELSRTREYAMNDKRCHQESKQKRSEILRKEYVDMNRNIPLPLDVALKRFSKSKNQGSSVYRNPYTSEELLNEYQHAASQLKEHYPSQYRKFRERLQSDSNVQGSTPSAMSDVIDYEPKDVATAYKKIVRMSESEPGSTTFPTEYFCPKAIGNRFSDEHEATQENRQNGTVQEISLGLSDCHSPMTSDFGEDSTFDLSRSSSWAGEVVPINLRSSIVARLSSKLISVPSPMVPTVQQQQQLVPKMSDDSGIGTIMDSHSFIEAACKAELKEKISNLSTFRDDSKFERKENSQPYPKMGQQNTKKYDLNRMSTMESISEEPGLELNRSEENAGSQEDTGAREKIKSNVKKRASSIHPEASKASSQDSDRDVTPKRKAASCKLLRKKWSLAMSENHTDFLDQVVDEDSLIGLSEEELIARQLRTRSIRKAIQQRIKEEIAT